MLALDGSETRPGRLRIRAYTILPGQSLSLLVICAVAVDAAVAQERPVAADVFHHTEVNFADQNFFLVVRGLGDDAAERIAEERCAPEFQAISGSGIAPDVSGFVSHTIYHRDVHAVGDGMGALDGAPGVVLRLSELRFLRGMPADRGGIEQDLGALQRGQAGAFGIPLVPAHQRAHAADGGVESAIAQVAGGEVILFVVERVVGDVHLAIEPAQGAVRVEDDGRVVIDAGGALLE